MKCEFISRFYVFTCTCIPNQHPMIAMWSHVLAYYSYLLLFIGSCRTFISYTCTCTV